MFSVEKFKSLEALSLGAGGLTDQSAADKTHGLTVSKTRVGSVAWKRSIESSGRNECS